MAQWSQKESSPGTIAHKSLGLTGAKQTCQSEHTSRRYPIKVIMLGQVILLATFRNTSERVSHIGLKGTHRNTEKMTLECIHQLVHEDSSDRDFQPQHTYRHLTLA